jgi:hypothetical protein
VLIFFMATSKRLGSLFLAWAVGGAFWWWRGRGPGGGWAGVGFFEKREMF